MAIGLFSITSILQALKGAMETVVTSGSRINQTKVSYGTGLSAIQVAYIVPQQVAGMVPLFPCCDDDAAQACTTVGIHVNKETIPINSAYPGNGTADYTITQSPYNIPILPGSVVITFTRAGTTYAAHDDGAGNISGTAGIGLVNYATGMITFHFVLVPPPTTSEVFFISFDSVVYNSCDVRVDFSTGETTTVNITTGMSDAQACAIISTAINNNCTPYNASCAGGGIGGSSILRICAPAGASGNSKSVIMTNLCSPTILQFYNQQTSITKQLSGGKDASDTDCMPCMDKFWNSDVIKGGDKNYTMYVFANPEEPTDFYTNDFNSWLFLYPPNYDAIGGGDFKLQEYSGGTWTTVATLNNATYGIPYNSGSTLSGPAYKFQNITLDPLKTPARNVDASGPNYQGFIISWLKVYNSFGAGIYRFNKSNGTKYCDSTPPFCLGLFDCNKANGTAKFEMNYLGGNMGNVNRQGNVWTIATPTSPIAWYDSVRMYAFFGNPSGEFERTSIKYASGIINKVRDELIEKFTVRTAQLPLWLIKRFAAYALQADQLYVSDYNLNNPDYSYRRYYIVADSQLTPKYFNFSRYPKVMDLQFKDGIQAIYRSRCNPGSALAIQTLQNLLR